MSKNHVNSDKISGNHTTFIEAAVPIIKELVKTEEVRRVTPGFIESGLKTSRDFPVSVKLTMGDDCLKLLVRQKISVQEIYIYTSNTQVTTELAARTARNEGHHIHFDKREVNDLTLRTRPGTKDRR